MNYYRRHLGDYAKRTTTLTMAEHGAYNLLLDYYYVTEQPIPQEDVYTLTRASLRVERASVDRVLEKFFELIGGAWRHERCEAEIAAYVAEEPKRDEKRKKANDRQNRARERRAALFEQLRLLGVVPAYNTTTRELEALVSRYPSRVTSEPVTPPVTRDVTASIPTLHSPLPGIQRDSEKNLRKDPLLSEPVTPVTRDSSVSEPSGMGVLNIKKTSPKSPRNGEWESVVERVLKSLAVVPDPAHPDYALLAKVSALTEAQCREAVKQLTDRGRLPKANGTAVHDA